MESPLKDAALRYLQRGFSIVPLRPGKKEPLGEWEEKEYTEVDVAFFKGNINLGVKLGTPYGGGLLVCVDLDWPEARRLGPWLLEMYPSGLYDAAGGHIGHIFYIADRAESRRFSFSAAPAGRSSVIVELLGRGRYVVVPPSVREDGSRRVWLRDEEPGRVDYEDLVRALRALAAACILGMVWRRGNREHAALALAGALWRRGWDAADVKRLMAAICIVAGDEEKEKRLRCVDDTFNEARTVQRTGIPRLKEVLDPTAVAVALNLLDVHEEEEDEDKSAADKSTQKIQALLEALEPDIEVFRTTAQRTIVVVQTGRGRRTWPVASTEFEDFITARGWEAVGLVPGTEQIKKIIRLLRARAPEDPEPTFTRVARLRDKVYVQLGRERFAEIGPGGYRMVRDVPVRFLTLYNLQDLPDPESGGSIDELREFVNVDDSGWLLIKIFMLAAFNTEATFPVLFLTGYQGTGKTTAATAIKRIIDPTSQGTRGSINSLEDLFIAAQHEHLLVLDNISTISDSLSDALCTIADGITYAKRTLYTNYEESLLYSHNPIIITAIEECINRPDLLDRTFMVETRPGVARRVEADLRVDLERVRGRVLGALFEAVSAALRREPEVSPPALPRLTGAARWAVAAAPELGASPDDVLDVMFQCRRDVSARFRDSDLIYQTLLAVFHDLVGRGGAEVNINTTELYREFSQRASGATLNVPDYPKSPAALTRKLRRLAPVFEEDGFLIRQGRTREERFWVIQKCSKD